MIVDEETGAARDLKDERRQVLSSGKLEHPMTRTAGQIVPMAQAGQGVAVATRFDVDAADDPELLEERQGAINRHQSYGREAFSGVAQHLLRSEPALGLEQRLKHSLPRPGQPVAAVGELVEG
jgi:hypothetical protein